MNRHLLATIAAVACTAVAGLGCDHNSTDTNAPAQNATGHTNMQAPQYQAEPGTQSAIGPNYVDAAFGLPPGDTMGRAGEPSNGPGNTQERSADSYGHDGGWRGVDMDPSDSTNDGTHRNSAVGGAPMSHPDGGPYQNISPLSPPAGYSHRR